jgi:predicted Zn-dependent peptidase
MNIITLLLYMRHCGLLKNNWNYILSPKPCLDTVTILILFRAGSIYELSGERGISHFIEHLFFQGNHGNNKSNKLTGEIYRHGGYINAFTSYDYTGYFVKISSKYLEKGLEVMSKILFQSEFSNSDIEKEKDIVIHENRKHRSDPVRVLGQINYENIFRNTPLAEDIGGTDKEIMNFNRQKIMKYLSERYQHAVISLAGNFQNKNIIELLNNYFNQHINSNHNSPNKSPKLPILPPIKYLNISNKFNKSDKSNKSNKSDKSDKSDKSKIKIIPSIFEESYLSIALPLSPLKPENHIERAATELLCIVLAGNMNSQLFLLLREKLQLIYNINYSINYYEIGGELSLQCGTQSKNIHRVCKEIISILQYLKIHGLTKSEFNDAVKFQIGELTLMTEDSKEVAFYQAYQYMFINKCWTLNDEIDIYRNLHLEEINKIISHIIDIPQIHISILKK